MNIEQQPGVKEMMAAYRDNTRCQNGKNVPRPNRADLNRSHAISPSLNNHATKKVKSAGRPLKHARERPVLSGKLMRAQRLILAAVRVWELKRGFSEWSVFTRWR